jgi:hypothetical protein
VTLPRALFNCNVWGAPFVRRFVDLVLPCQLAPGNLGDLPGIADGLYLIGTTEEDRAAIAAAPATRVLARLMPVEYVTDIDRTFHKYRILNRYQNVAMIRAVAGDFGAFVPTYADQVWAAGSFRAALERIGAGAAGVFAQGPRGAELGFAGEILARRAGGIAAIPPRALVQLFLRHRHPFEDAFFVDAPRFTSYSSHVNWRVGNEGLVVHNFHLHPVALRVMGERPVFTSVFAETLDSAFLDDLLKADDPIHVVADSDELFMCSLDDDLELGSALIGERPFDISELALFAVSRVRPLGLRFWRETCLYHSGKIEGPTWKDAIASARSTAESLLAIVEQVRRQNAAKN